eukprot:363697-Chlamydomonas_euryale.AAC.3
MVAAAGGSASRARARGTATRSCVAVCPRVPRYDRASPFTSRGAARGTRRVAWRTRLPRSLHARTRQPASPVTALVVWRVRRKKESGLKPLGRRARASSEAVAGRIAPRSRSRAARSRPRRVCTARRASHPHDRWIRGTQRLRHIPACVVLVWRVCFWWLHRAVSGRRAEQHPAHHKGARATLRRQIHFFGTFASGSCTLQYPGATPSSIPPTTRVPVPLGVASISASSGALLPMTRPDSSACEGCAWTFVREWWEVECVEGGFA